MIHRNYSHSWQRYGVDSYCYKHRTSFGNYSFIGIDAHPMPGPRLPYNFFGVLDEVMHLSHVMYNDCVYVNRQIY